MFKYVIRLERLHYIHVQGLTKSIKVGNVQIDIIFEDLKSTLYFLIYIGV